MERRHYSSGSSFERAIGYARAIRVKDIVFVSGCTGYDYSTMTISTDVVEQCEQCFRNIETALQEVGATMRDLVRVTFILPDAADFEACHETIRSHIADAQPAATMLCAGLANELMKIEIEVTAVVA